MCKSQTKLAEAILGTTPAAPPADPLEAQRQEAAAAVSIVKQRGARLSNRLGNAYVRSTEYAESFKEFRDLNQSAKPGDATYDHQKLMDKFAQLQQLADALEQTGDELEQAWNDWIQELWQQLTAFRDKVAAATHDYQQREANAAQLAPLQDAFEDAIGTQEKSAIGMRARPLVQQAFDAAMELLGTQMAGPADDAPLVAKSEVSTTGDAMDDYKERDDGEAIEHLIDKFDVVLVSTAEAKTTKDYIVKFGADKRKRIDRQGPAYDNTHAKFALQLGTATVAGVEMQCDYQFDIAFVRAAFRESLRQKRYIRIYAE